MATHSTSATTGGGNATTHAGSHAPVAVTGHKRPIIAISAHLTNNSTSPSLSTSATLATSSTTEFLVPPFFPHLILVIEVHRVSRVGCWNETPAKWPS